MLAMPQKMPKPVRNVRVLLHINVAPISFQFSMSNIVIFIFRINFSNL